MRKWRTHAAAVAAIALAATACGGTTPTADQPGGTTGGTTGATTGNAGMEPGDELTGSLVGAGATFVNPLMQEWIGVYTTEVQPGVSINYQSIGSGGGVEQFILQSVDFGATEGWLSDEEVEDARQARGCEPLHIPFAFGAVVPTYNGPWADANGIGDGDLVLDAEAIAHIFLREVTHWNDPMLVALNPDLDLPADEILPVHRSDGSGTTFVFVTYLDDEVPLWHERLGRGREVNWPAGTYGGPGNEGVAAFVQQNAGALGYNNIAYGVENDDIYMATVINADGNPIYPTPESVAAAPNGIVSFPDDLRFDILGVGGDGFPIAGTVWVLAWECGYDPNTAAILRDFLTWGIDHGDAIAIDLLYAPIKGNFAQIVQAMIDRIDVDDE